MAPLESKLREGLHHNKKIVKTVLIICVVTVAVTTTIIIIVVYFVASPSRNFEEPVSNDSKSLESEELNLKNKTLSIRIRSAPQSNSKYPFMVFLVFNLNTDTTEPVSFCGGTIINERTILTAAHCIHNATSVDVLVGISHLDDATNSMLSGGQLIIHEEYNDKNYDNDIGLIQLDSAIELNDHTNIVFLNFINNVHHFKVPSDSDVVLGWGLNKTLGLNNELLIKHVNLTDNEECFTFYNQYNFVLDDSKILCTVSKEGGPCYSDSGGPLLQENIQIGLVSAGDENCTPNTPTRYMNIAFYRKWIENYLVSSKLW